MARLRLLKIVMQPTFVLDDGEHLTEQLGDSFIVLPSQLDGFVERFKGGMADLAAQVESAPPDPTEEPPTCPKCGAPMVHAGGLAGPLVCTSPDCNTTDA